MKMDSPITDIKGVGAKTAEAFLKMDVQTVSDLLRKYPRTYMKYPKAEELNSKSGLSEGMYALSAKVTRSVLVKNTRKMPISILELGEEGHKIELIWYRMPYIKNTIQYGKNYVFYGKVVAKNKHYVMEQPAVFEPQKYEEMEEKLLPVYSLTAGITNNFMMKCISGLLCREELCQDLLPAAIRSRYSFCEYNYALKQIHYPDSMETLIEARSRLVFDEFFCFILSLQYHKEETRKEKNSFSFDNPGFIQELIKKLPYQLTNAQLHALEDIKTDLLSPYVMQRLIQGDVGSGKTIVAFLAMAWVGNNGYQSAIMAPTEVLARQHYETYLKLCRQFGLDLEVILLVGSMTTKQKKEAYEKIRLIPNAMIVGTHALIQEKVDYYHLALVITDEQHRFGVKQRDTFSGKGNHPHILVMSATPIPRTLAIILYGDLDITVIDEVPAKRVPIKNCVVNTGYRKKAYEFMQEQIRLGHQVYVICPLIEKSEGAEGEDVNSYAEILSEHLPSDIKIGVLHGKMKAKEKNDIMERFSMNRIQILVSTTVVEVGVNVPNATVMMIENADKFGLAQLHQLRGRVGRGDAQSYCIMINTSDGKSAKERLEILNQSNDGFRIANSDLKMRGPGDFFGIRQSGELAFSLADIYQDADLLQKASLSVHEVLESDPDLEKEENRNLRRYMDAFEKDQKKKMNL